MITEHTAVSAGRDTAVDLLKAVAIFCVVAIHASFGGYSYPVSSGNWFAAVFWGSLVRSGVPVFLMCSGALLLDPEKRLTVPTLYRKNLFRIVAAMYFWAAAYKLYGLLTTGGVTAQGAVQSVKEILLFHQEFHLYYLHIMILVYLFLPVTRILTANASKRQLEYLLAVWFLFGIVYPTARAFWPFTLLSGTPAQWVMPMPYSAIGYGVLGYYMKRHAGGKAWPYLLMFALGFACVFGGTAVMSARQGWLYEGFLEGMSPGVALMAAGLFGAVTVRCRGGRRVPAAERLSRASFCIYLVHVFFLYTLTGLGFTVALLPCAVSVPLLAAAVFACSYAVYLVLSRVPVVRTYLI